MMRSDYHILAPNSEAATLGFSSCALNRIPRRVFGDDATKRSAPGIVAVAGLMAASTSVSELLLLVVSSYHEETSSRMAAMIVRPLMVLCEQVQTSIVTPFVRVKPSLDSLAT